MKKNAVVIYKNFCAVVSNPVAEGDKEKFEVTWCPSRGTPGGKKPVYATQKVRSRDVVLLKDESASSLEKLLELSDNDDAFEPSIEEVYELLMSDDSTCREEINFLDLCELVKSSAQTDEIYAIYRHLKNTLYFEEKINLCEDGIAVPFFVPRTQEKIEELKQKAFEKENGERLRQEFLERLKQKKLNLPEDAKFMADVETLALGQTDKSKTLHDAGIKETPEKAHKILLDTGVWDYFKNPYPVRWGLSSRSASEVLPSPDAGEERIEVNHVSYAIDNAYSNDPDDAIAFDGEYLWVHIADPAGTVMPDSSIDKVARGRGATLYIPEGAARMLAEKSLEDYALGLNEKSFALSFKIKLDDKGNIEDCEVLRTIVKVKRYTYEEADQHKNESELKPLYEIASRNYKRRCEAGAVNINMPEVHITVNKEEKSIKIEEDRRFESSDVVREMMLLAGEGAAYFASKNNLPFPYISQESCELPKEIPEGLAGEFKKRKFMRKRNVTLEPMMHFGLGLKMYSQVTSPLRRYGDLISHQQLRLFLKGEPLIDSEDMLLRMSEGDASARACKQAERNSKLHWTLVYLLQNPDWSGEAVCLDNTLKGGKEAVFSIPSLGIETVLTPSRKCELNDRITVKVKSIDLPLLEVIFQGL